MSKIIQAVNAMCEKQYQISDVIPAGQEYFFLFNKRYKWSINYDKQADNFWLYYYPENIPLKDLVTASKAGPWPETIQYMAYNSNLLGTKEAYQTFSDLHAIVKEKLLGIDKVLDDIIEGEDKPF